MDINMCVDLRSVGSTVKIESAGAINVDVSISIRYFFINICSLKWFFQGLEEAENAGNRQRHTLNTATNGSGSGGQANISAGIALE